MAYDIFISYRRDGGEYTAKILRDHLQEAGYRAFFDVESLRSGDFNTKLYSVIDECTDFLLILSPGALDRCKNADDWVRREVEYALEKGKNVIPIMLRSFSFPDELPESLEPLRYRNGLEANSQFFDAFLQQLKGKFLLTKPPVWRRFSQSSILRRTLPVFLALILLLGLGLGVRAIVNSRNSVYPSTKAEKNLTDEVIYYVSCNLTNLDLAGSAMDTAIQASQRYLSVGEGDYAALQNRLEACRNTMTQIDIDQGAPSSSLLERLTDSPYHLDDLVALHDAVKSFLDGWLNSLDYIDWLMSPNCHMSTEDKLETLTCYQTILNESLLGHAYCCNELFLPVTADSAMDEFWYTYLPELIIFPLQASEWETEEAVLESKIEQCFNRQEDALLALTTITGNTNMENAEMADENAKLKESIIENYMSMGYSREEAEGLLDSLMELRALCLPRSEDDVNTLWYKMGVLLEYYFYDDALDCIDNYWELAKDDADAQKYLPAARAYIEFCRKNGLCYGVMVMAYYEPDGINEVFEIGDVIVAFNGEPCRSYESYAEQKSQCEENTYTLLVLRMNEAGEMVPMQLELSKDMPAVYLNTLVDPQ